MGKISEVINSEEVLRMKNPVMFIHPNDVIELGDTPTLYKGIQVSKDTHCEKGKFYITDIKTDLL